MEAMEVPGVISCQNKALTTPLLFDPGERWYYGINIDWAGKMVEAVSGKKLGRYMRDNILGPLGMDSTGFTITDEHAQAPGQDPSSRRRRRAAARHRARAAAGPEFEMGGGGLYSTAGDYLKFVRMMLNQRQVRPRRGGAEARDGGRDVEKRHGRQQGRAC